MGLIRWLNKPFPLIEQSETKLFVSFLIGLFVFIFLIIFQPFGVSTLIDRNPFYISGFGLITFLSIFFNMTFLPVLFNSFFESTQWKVKKELILLLCHIVVIGFLNYRYCLVIDPEGGFTLFNFIGKTAVIAIFPGVFYPLMVELSLSKKNQGIATELNKKLSQRTSNKNNSKIMIHTELKKDRLEVSLPDLLFIRSEGNYCSIAYKKEDKHLKKLVRTSLKNIEQQIGSRPNIIRCHRSYIINKDNISNISGNARGYHLHFDHCQDLIPVSREFPKEKLYD